MTLFGHKGVEHPFEVKVCSHKMDTMMRSKGCTSYLANPRDRRSVHTDRAAALRGEHLVLLAINTGDRHELCFRGVELEDERGLAVFGSNRSFTTRVHRLTLGSLLEGNFPLEDLVELIHRSGELHVDGGRGALRDREDLFEALEVGAHPTRVCGGEERERENQDGNEQLQVAHASLLLCSSTCNS
jgi:hypothetical protein